MFDVGHHAHGLPILPQRIVQMSFTSFLVDGDDEQLTLEAALALIENCDAGEAELSNGSNGSESASPASTRSAAQDGDAESAGFTSPGSNTSDSTAGAKRPRTFRGKRKPGASTEQQRRQKQEIQSLREQAEVLEVRLRQLKRRYGPQPDPASTSGENDAGLDGDDRYPSAVTKKQRAVSMWMELAIVHYRERQRAELTNRKLKEIWGNQSKLNEAIKHLVGKRSAVAGQEFVFRQPVLYDTPSPVHISTSVMAELEQSMHAMYLESAAMFRPADVSAYPSSVTSINYQSGVGMIVDFVTTSSMPCSISEASSAVWQQSHSNMKFPDKTFTTTMPDENSAEKTMSWTIRDGNRKVQLDGWHYLRKFDEPARTVVVRAGLIAPTSSGLKLRDRSWTIVAPTPGMVAPHCVIRYCYRLYIEFESGTSFSPNDLNSFQQLVSTNVVACMGAFVGSVRQAIER